MSVSSVSFWQQDQNWLASQQNWDQQIVGSNAVNNALTTALTNKSSGLASIYNQEALTRVTNQLQSAAKAALQSGSSSSSGNAASIPTAPTNAAGLSNFAANLQSASTAESVLSSVLSNESASSGIAGLLSGSLVNVIA